MPSIFFSRTSSAMRSTMVALFTWYGNLRDDDRFAILADGVDRHLAAHHDRAAAEMIGRADALAAEDDAAGRKIRTRNDVDEVVDAKRGIVDQRDAGVDDFAEIVRRDVGGHADGDAAGAVDQQVRKLRRQDRRLLLAVVVVRLEIDGVLVDVVEQRVRDLGQARLRCSASAAGISPSTEPKLPCPSISGTRMEKSCAMRTIAS